MKSCKRLVLSLLLTVCASGLVPAFAAGPVFGPASGEFVVYRDRSWKAPTWIGFLCYDANTWGAFAKTPSTGSDVSVLFRTEEVDGELVLTGQQIISDITERDVSAVNYLMGLLPDLYKWHQEARAGRGAKQAKAASSDAGIGRSVLLPPLVVLERSSESFGGALELVFAAEVPVFSLRSASVPKAGTIFSLEKAGRVTTGDDRDFFGFTPRSACKDATPFTLAETRTARQYSIDGLILNLDDQWTALADNTFMLGNTAVLIADTIDLTAAGVSGDLPSALVRLFSSSGKASWILPEYTAVRGTPERMVIENRVFDVNSQLVNRDIKVCLPSADGTSCRIISLTVSDAAWAGNESYFNSLF